jgi:hypothetical protein
MSPAAVAAAVSAKIGKELKVITPPLEAVLPNLPPFLAELLKAYAEDNSVSKRWRKSRSSQSSTIFSSPILVY